MRAGGSSILGVAPQETDAHGQRSARFPAPNRPGSGKDVFQFTIYGVPASLTALGFRIVLTIGRMVTHGLTYVLTLINRTTGQVYHWYGTYGLRKLQTGTVNIALAPQSVGTGDMFWTFQVEARNVEGVHIPAEASHQAFGHFCWNYPPCWPFP